MKQLIVLATDSLEPSGVGEHMLTLAIELRDRFDIVVAAPGDGEGAALLWRAATLGLRIKALDNADPGGDASWLRRSRASLVHVHAGIGWEGHALARSGKAAGLPVLRTEHLPYLLTDPVQKAEYRAMLSCVDRQIAVSDTVYRSLADQGFDRLTLVQNGIAERTGAPLFADARRAIGVAEDDRLIITVARLSPQKGHSVLLAALPAILSRQPKARIILVGRGPERDAIEEQVRSAGLDHAVRLLGQRDDVPDLLASADLFVLPSHFEGLPLALLEAMACGLPAVATAIGGSIEALGSDYPYLVPPDNAEALADAVLEALGDLARARTIAASAHARFRERFTAARMAATTAYVYQTLMHLQPARGTIA